MCWGTLSVVVLAAVGGIYALYHINTQIRRHVLVEMEKRFPDLEVDIGHVRLDESKGITISDLELSVPGVAGQPSRILFHTRELFLACPVTIPSLFRKEIRISKAVMRNPVICLTRTADGGFADLHRFKSSENHSASLIPVEIVDGIVLYSDVRSAHAPPLKVTGVSMTLTPPDKNGGAPLLSEEEEEKTARPRPLVAARSWTFAGTAGGDLFHQLSFEGNFEPERRHWELYALCRQLYWNSDYLDYLAPEKPLLDNPEHKKTLESFQGRFDFGLSAVADPEAPLKCRFAVEGTLFQGSATLYEADRTLSELGARFRVTDDGIDIEKLTGLGEAARLTLSYSQEGLFERRNTKLTASIKGLDFDEHFVRSLHPFLNENTKNLLARYSYAGRTDLDTELNCVSGVWKPKFLTLNISDLSFSFLEFPYRVERIAGRFHVDESAKLDFNLATKPEEALRATIVGQYANVFVDPVGQVRIIGENVPIDDKLFSAIPEEQRTVVTSLRPGGKINADLLLKLPPNDAPLEKIFEIGLDNISVEYENFPYPLQKVCGSLRLDDDAWTFENVAGNNGSAVVKCSGHLKPIPGVEASELLIDIQAAELPVDEQLSKAVLDLQQRELLDGFRIKGKVDIEAQVRFRTDQRQLNLRFCAIPCAGLSIQPERFPYRIDDVQGQFYYENGNISSKLLTATHRDTRIRAGLECRFSPGGQWMLRLAPLTVYQLVPDRELLDALPPNIRSFHENLKLDQPLNLNGTIEFSKQGDKLPLLTVWDTGIVLHQNSLHFGFPVENVFGKVRLTGYAVDDAFRLAGELDIESATVRGYPVSQVKGPFFHDGIGKNQLYLGQEAGKYHAAPPAEIPVPDWFRQSSWFVSSDQARPIVGQFFEGTLFAEGLVILNNNTTYSIKTALIGADLARIARHLEPKTQKVAGTLNCRSHFYGNGRTLDALAGQGSIQLRNANIYEAPGMIRLLRELSIRETDPNAGAFSSADIDFRLHGPRMRLDRITFEGGAFHLKGDGEVRLDNRQMNLVLQTRLGSKRWQIPGVSDLLGGVGDQLVQLNVHGPLSDPTVARVLAPGVQKVIGSIQGEESDDYVPPAVPATPGAGLGVPRLFQGRNRPF